MVFGKMTSAIQNLNIRKASKITPGAHGPSTALNPASQRESAEGLDDAFDRQQVPRPPRDFSKQVPSPAALADMKKPHPRLTHKNVDKFADMQIAKEAYMLVHPSETRVMEWLEKVPLH
jgi:hypothetical protein